jgi:protein Mpv17
VKGVAYRILGDQSINAPAFTFLFFSGMGLLNGMDTQQISTKLQNDYFTTLKANWCVWPFIQLVNFFFVPLHARVLYVNVAAVFWNAYLSFMNYKH